MNLSRTCSPHRTYRPMAGTCLMLTLMLWAAHGLAQTPEAFRYQAVARDGGGQLVVNTAVGLQFQLHQGSASGTVVYAETHSPTTNAQGLFTVGVGEGSPTSGTFSAIDWSTGPYFVEVGLDPAGGTTYSSIGVQQLLSVPYALQAKEADTAGHATTSDTASYAAQAGPPGSAAGEIRYWNGTAWVSLPPGSNGQPLVFCNGAVRWGNCPVQARLNNGETPCAIANSGMPLDSLWGKSYLGGLIAYLDPNTCQGFVASMNATEAVWMVQSSSSSNPSDCAITYFGTSTDLFTGAANSALIDAPPCNTNAVHDLHVVVGPAWSLPSKDELAQVYAHLHLNGYGGFLATPYWSSSENGPSSAWAIDFANGSSLSAGKDDTNAYFWCMGVKYF